MKRHDISKLETFAIRAERLSSLASALNDAMNSQKHNVTRYLNGVDFLDDLLSEYASELNAYLIEINDSHKGGVVE